ncbi:MAG: pyrimidine-nucleoside phosphorylase [Clostridiales bacterium]|nr:pyrimidine-nucleoside phosphorylase [Clostridiales bacterium]
MRMYDIIENKRNGKMLSKEEIDFFIEGYTKGEIPDYQASALTMAIFFQGMNKEETVNLTLAMAKSGDMIDLSGIDGKCVDKHSTGGVGDKTTLIVAPIAAAAGCKVAKMSGRGLGHTGGTIDKLESIKGFSTAISVEDFINQVNKIGLCVAGQTGHLAPADKKLYALRDVTATVDNISLIASSIMSKKLASGAQNILLDVKTGSGAFMKTLEGSKELAKTMVEIGNGAGRNTRAVITNMDIPLGHAVGNSLEVKEAIEFLNGKADDDLKEVCVTLAANMISLCFENDIEQARQLVLSAIDDGSALEKLALMVEAQGGNKEWIYNPSLFPQASIEYELKATESGYIKKMDTEKIGIASCLLGAGRLKVEDSIDYSAGITIKAKTGDKIEKGDIIAILHTNNKDFISNAEKTYLEALTVSETKPEKEPLIYS